MKIFELLQDFGALSVEELEAYIANTLAKIQEVAAAPESFVSEDFSSAELRAQVVEARDSLAAARVELAERDELAEGDDEEADFSEIADLAAEAEEAAAETPEDEDDADGDETDESTETAAADADAAAVETEKPAPAAVVAAATRRVTSRPARARRAAPSEAETAPSVSLVAAAPNLGFDVGQELPNEHELAKMMEARRGQFGMISEGTHGEKIPIARARWSELYPDERTFTGNTVKDAELIAAATDQRVIRHNMDLRMAENGLVASGGLCAPVTPYYALQMLSVAERPVRGALPAFNADRGGIKFARPATLASITTAVGVKTVEQDGAGGTEAQKTCQVVDCPDFEEIDVQILFHCLQFGNLGARTFPERVAQWNNLVLAAHARLAESELLTGIDTVSTQVSASALGLGASATIPSQVLAAAAGMRSRHRMDPNAVLRVMFPQWVLALLTSDVYRSQFGRFDMGPDQFIALLRDANVEPTFYIDGANGRGQVFNTQGATGLDPFPENVVWYLYPEGSFLFVDGGTLELGLVRDSVLNKTNDFQIFGESFENVAFVGIESLAIETPVCDTGIVSGPTAQSVDALACPYVYTV